MGLYNYQLERLPAPLNNNRCFICDSVMTPYNKDPEMDAFQYKCSNCNPNVIIEISGSLLASSLYERLRNNPVARQNIRMQIQQREQQSFPITTAFTSSFI